MMWSVVFLYELKNLEVSFDPSTSIPDHEKPDDVRPLEILIEILRYSHVKLVPIHTSGSALFHPKNENNDEKDSI